MCWREARLSSDREKCSADVSQVKSATWAKTATLGRQRWSPFIHKELVQRTSNKNSPVYTNFCELYPHCLSPLLPLEMSRLLRSHTEDTIQ